MDFLRIEMDTRREGGQPRFFFVACNSLSHSLIWEDNRGGFWSWCIFRCSCSKNPNMKYICIWKAQKQWDVCRSEKNTWAVTVSSEKWSRWRMVGHILYLPDAHKSSRKNFSLNLSVGDAEFKELRDTASFPGKVQSPLLKVSSEQQPKLSILWPQVVCSSLNSQFTFSKLSHQNGLKMTRMTQDYSKQSEKSQ